MKYYKYHRRLDGHVTLKRSKLIAVVLFLHRSCQGHFANHSMYEFIHTHARTHSVILHLPYHITVMLHNYTYMHVHRIYIHTYIHVHRIYDSTD